MLALRIGKQKKQINTILALSFILHCSCAYRFSNVALKRPSGVRSLAIEAVYDTTRQVIPSQILWSELQKEFARDGKLIITSSQKADVILIPTITGFQATPTNLDRDKRDKDPEGDAARYQNPGDSTNGFRDLLSAGSSAMSEHIGFYVNIVVINLKTKETLFSRSYSLGAEFGAYKPQDQTPKTHQYLSYTEIKEATFRNLSKDLAQRVVTDFYLKVAAR